MKESIFFEVNRIMDRLFTRGELIRPRLHREIITSLDTKTDLRELASYLKETITRENDWKLVMDRDDFEDGFILVFHIPRKPFGVTWPQHVAIACEVRNPEVEKTEIFIRSEFIGPHLSERKALSGNCDVCRKAVSNFFSAKGVDTEPIDCAETEGDILKGTVAEKKINPFIAILIVLLLISFFLIYLFFIF